MYVNTCNALYLCNLRKFVRSFVELILVKRTFELAGLCVGNMFVLLCLSVRTNLILNDAFSYNDFINSSY
jgi:hypothetical protein